VAIEPFEQHLMEQAEAAADTILSGADFPPLARQLLEPNRPWLRPLLAIAWIEGRQAGGQEAQAIVRNYMQELLS